MNAVSLKETAAHQRILPNRNNMKKKLKSGRMALLVGTYCGLNKGDRLMQEIASANLMRELGMRVIIASPFPALDHGLYSDIKVIKSYRRNLPYAFVRTLFLFLLPSFLRPYLLKIDQETRAYQEANLIVDLSGDMLTEDYGIHVGISHLFPLLTAIIAGKRLAIIAQSIGPFRYLKFYYKWVLSKASLITVRDPISFDYLKGLGIPNVYATADIGFLLEKEVTDCVLKSGIRYIGIVPSSLIANKFAHTNQSMDALLNALNAASENRDICYVLIPHVDSPKKKYSDSVICTQMVGKLKADALVLDANLSPGAVKHVISQLDGVLSYRMHAAISALDSTVPCLVVSYSHKTIGLYEKLGIPDWVVTLSNNGEAGFLEKIISLIDGRLKFPRYFSERLNNERRLAMKNFSLLSDL